MLMFAVLARERGRIVSLSLLSLLFLISWRVQAAHANGVSGTISNGKTVNGMITGKSFDTYTFKVASGSSFIVSAAEAGPHDKNFMPRIDLTNPKGVPGRGIWTPLHARLVETKAAEGTWSVKVSRGYEGNTGGAYTLTLIELPGALPASAGFAGGAMSTGKTYSGSSKRGNIDVWTFNGAAGHDATITLSRTGGDRFIPEVYVFAPTGALVSGLSCAKTCGSDVPVKTDGTYTVTAWRDDDADITGTYSLSVNDKN